MPATKKLDPNELRHEKAMKLDAAKAITAAATVEERDLTEEQDTKVDALVAEAKDLEAQAVAFEAQERKVLARNQDITDLLTPADPLDRGSVAAVGRDLPTLPAIPLPYGRLRTFKGEINGMPAHERAYRFGICVAASWGQSWARQRAEQFGLDNILAAQTEGANTGGGFLVFPEFSPDIIDLIETYGVARRLMDLEPMASDTKNIPRTTGELTTYFVGENAAATESEATWDQVGLIARKLMAITKISNELREDSIVNIGDKIAKMIARAFAKTEDECGFKGDGSQTYGGIHGLNPRMLAVHGVVATVGQALGAGNLLSKITLANYHSAVGKLPSYAEAEAKWYTSKWVWSNSMQALASAAGGNTWETISNGRREKMFIGYPVELVNGCFPTSDANSQVLAVLGDLEMAASFGDRRQAAIVTKEVDDDAKYDRVSILGRERFDINVHDVGDTTTAGPVISVISAAS